MKGKMHLGSEAKVLLMLLCGGIACNVLGQTDTALTESTNAVQIAPELSDTNSVQTEPAPREPDQEPRTSLTGERALDALKRSLTNDAYNMHWGAIRLRT